MIAARSAPPAQWIVLPAAIGFWAALIAAAPSLKFSAALAAPLVLAAVAWWTLSRPHRWAGAFIATALLLPPLPIALGNSGPHPCLLFAALGILAGALHLRDWRITSDHLTRTLICLFIILLASVGFAAIYSGAAIAIQSLARVMLFGIGVYLFLYTAYLGAEGGAPRLTLLFWAAVVSAAIACLDFYYQLPAPAGFGPQFIWTETGRYRRAQGIFYEASTLGNFCAFFLVMIAVALTRRGRQPVLPRSVLMPGGIVLSAALIFSYSRASVVNLVVALLMLVWLERSRIRWRRAVPLLTASFAAAIAFGYYFLPEFAAAYWRRLSSSTFYFFDYGEAVFSGRFESWRTLVHFLTTHPWHGVFGIGYKTLPYSDYIGQSVIGDNMYLSLLVETGVLGLAALIAVNLSILAASRRAARNPDPQVSFLGTWMFCFWAGQCVQMLSSDLLTYWRVLPVYFLVLAWAVRASRQAAAQ